MSGNMVQLKSNLCGLFDCYNQILVFDVETSGLDAIRDEIIEITFLKLKIDSKGIINWEVEDYFINLPDRKLSSVIVNLTGITDEVLRERGHPRALIAEKIKSILHSRRTLLIAHNANFDMNFLLAMLRKERHNIDMESIDVIDTLTIFKDRHPYPHKLSDAVVTYGLVKYVKNSHRSVDDAIATLCVFDAMCIERNDVRKYINLIGVNPKYGIKPREKIRTIRYLNQPYDCKSKLYELA